MANISLERALAAVVNDPWYWLQFVYTYDPASEEIRRKFPLHQYIEKIIREWQQNRILLVAKSSQQMASWLFVALHLWDVMYHPGRFGIFISTKESKAGFGSSDSGGEVTGTVLTLLGRAKFIYDNLPPVFRTPVVVSRQPPTMRFDITFRGKVTPSYLMGASSASVEARQWTLTNVLLDEAAFLPNAEEIFTAVLPRLTKNGRLTLISTPNGKDFFYSLLTDIV